MKICIITDEFPTVSETWIRDEIEHLARRGHQITLVIRRATTETWPFDDAVSLQSDVVREIPLPDSRLGLLWQACQRLARLVFVTPVTIAKTSLRRPLREAPKRLYFLPCFLSMDIDVVHAHFGPVAAQYSFVRDVLNVPFVVTFHGWDLRRGTREKGSGYKTLFRETDKVIAISKYSEEQLVMMGCPADKIQLIRLGVDARFPQHTQEDTSHDEIVVLTVARLSPEKNVELAVRAIAQATSDHPNLKIRFRVVGDGPERTAIMREAQKKGVFIEMLGSLTSQKVAQELGRAHIFLLSSISEVAPVAVMEAMSASLPVVSTNVGAISELVIDELTGFLAPQGDINALARALVKLGIDRELRQSMGTAGRERVLAYHDAERQLGALTELLEKLSFFRNGPSS